MLFWSVFGETVYFCLLDMTSKPNFGHLILERKYQIDGEWTIGRIIYLIRDKKSIFSQKL